MLLHSTLIARFLDSKPKSRLKQPDGWGAPHKEVQEGKTMPQVNSPVRSSSGGIICLSVIVNQHYCHSKDILNYAELEQDPLHRSMSSRLLFNAVSFFFLLQLLSAVKSAVVI